MEPRRDDNWGDETEILDDDWWDNDYAEDDYSYIVTKPSMVPFDEDNLEYEGD